MPGGWGGSSPNNANGQISPQDVIAFVHDAVNTLNNKVNNLEKIQSSIEQVVGPIDTNGDGVISPDEAKAAGAKLAASKDPRAADLLMSPETWILLGGSYLGIHGAKSGTVAVAKGLLGKLADHINEQNGNGTDANNTSTKAAP
jgi:hypothetical protein